MIVLPRTRGRELVDCYQGGLHREIFKVLRLVGRLALCCAGCFLCRAYFGDDAWPSNSRTRTDQWHCAPSLVDPRPFATLMISTRTGTGFLAAFRVVNGLSDARQRRAGRSVTPPRRARGW